MSINPPIRATPKPSAGPPCHTSNSGFDFAASRRATVSPDEIQWDPHTGYVNTDALAGVDAVIHLASFPRQKVVNNDPMQGSKAMSEGLLNLLELSRKHNVGRFTYISSSMVYGDFIDGVTEEAVCKPQGQYAIMKYAGELLVKDYTRQYNLDHTILRPSAVYGPVDVDDRVISKFMLNARENKPIRVFGKMEKLDFTFVSDVATGIVDATLSPRAVNETYNLTRSQGVTLYDAARMVSQIVGKGNIGVAKDLYVGAGAKIDREGAAQFTSIKIGANSITWAPVKPEFGVFTQGDIVYNSEPAVGKPVGWICLSSGTPGTWAIIGIASSLKVCYTVECSIRNTLGTTINTFYITANGNERLLCYLAACLIQARLFG